MSTRPVGPQEEWAESEERIKSWKRWGPGEGGKGGTRTPRGEEGSGGDRGRGEVLRHKEGGRREAVGTWAQGAQGAGW